MKISNVSIMIALICVMSCSTALFAQTRTTPVEVQNTPNVKVDPSGNTVKIDNTGNTVQVSGTPNVNVTNTPNVNVGTLPAVKVDPNQNTIRIDSTQNTVKAPTMSNQLVLWTSQALPHGSTISSGILSCTGYKELRIVATLPSAVNDAGNIQINVRFQMPNTGGYYLMGKGSFATPTTPLIPYANFTQSGGMALMIVPIMSNNVMIEIVNNTTATDTTVSAAWVYMVN
ncbi:MAG: hypothetical protein ABFD64_13920 [Armatimonadota bacterium]